jgi:hypothetical protein
MIDWTLSLLSGTYLVDWVVPTPTAQAVVLDAKAMPDLHRPRRHAQKL